VRISDPRPWLEEHTAELLARPGARLWGWHSGRIDDVRAQLNTFEGAAIKSRRSLWRVIRIGDETITLTAEPV
jgi:hypothetical protein